MRAFASPRRRQANAIFAQCVAQIRRLCGAEKTACLFAMRVRCMKSCMGISGHLIFSTRQSAAAIALQPLERLGTGVASDQQPWPQPGLLVLRNDLVRWIGARSFYYRSYIFANTWLDHCAISLGCDVFTSMLIVV